MAIQTSPQPPAAVVSSGWAGGSNLQAVQTNDGDASYIHYLVATVRDNPNAALQEWRFDFTGLPTDAYVRSSRLDVVARGFTGGSAFTPAAWENAITIGSDLGFPVNRSVTANYTSLLGAATLGLKAVGPSGSVSVNGYILPGVLPPSIADGVMVTAVSMVIWYSRPPNAPSLTSPTGDITTLIPQFQGTHNSPTNDALERVQIEVRRESDDALMWTEEFAASGTSWARAYGGTALVAGVTYKWRARTKSTGLPDWGAWSTWHTFRPVVGEPPVAGIVSPSHGSTVTSESFTLRWSYSSPDGRSQNGYQIQWRPVGGSVTWDTGLRNATSGTRTTTYGGPPLVEGDDYEWRVRVRDTFNFLSPYTSWARVTYEPSKPNPPTLTIDPLVDSLTFTIAGSYNQGTGDEEAGYYYELRQSGITIYQSGLVTGDLATGQAYGTVNPLGTPSTPPTLSWGTDYEIRAKSRDAAGRESDWSGWLPIRTQSPPTTPTNLSPNGAIIGNRFPTLTWQHNDPDGDPQTEAYVELEDVDTGAPVSGYPKTLSQATEAHTVQTELTDDPPTEYRWRVSTTGTPGAGRGAPSSWATFTVATAPVLSVLSPTPSQEVTAPGLVVEWEITGGGSGVQQSYRVRVYAADQSTVLHDSGTTGSVADQYAIPLGVLQNNGSYYVRVTVADTLNLIADSGLIPITTSWAPPSTITSLFAQAIGDQSDGIGGEQNPLPNIYLTWDESPEPVNSFLRYVIYRRIVGEGAWRQLAIITDRSLTSYNDHTVASDTLYEYIVIVVADVAGEEVESEPPVPAQAQVTIRSAFVHAHGEESVYAEFRAETQSVDMGQDIAYVQPRRSRAPVAHVGGQLAGVFELNVTDTWDPDLWRRVRALQEAQARGRVLMLRQHRDLCAYVVLESAQRSDQTTLMGLQLRFREVEAPEE